MAKPNFSAMLNTRMEDIEDIVALPDGTYYGTIETFEPIESSQKKTPGIKIQGKYTEVGDDVDAEELDKAGGIRRKNGQPKGWTFTFYSSEDNGWARLKEFIKSLGLTGETLGENLKALKGQEVYLVVRQELRNKEDTDSGFIARVDRIGARTE